MSICRRACLYLRRKTGKSILLLLTMYLLFSFAMAGLLLHYTTDMAIQQIRENLGGSFRIAPDMQNRDNVEIHTANGKTSVTYTGEPLDEKLIRKISAVREIAAYNAVLKGNALLQADLQLIDHNGKYQKDPVAAHLVSAEAATDPRLSALFRSGQLQMEKDNCTNAKNNKQTIASDHSPGTKRKLHSTRSRTVPGNTATGRNREAGTAPKRNPVQGKNEFTAIISKPLARKNNLGIGDEIQLSPADNDIGTPVRIKISGFFTIETSQPNTDIAAPSSLLENKIFLNLSDGSALFGKNSADYVDFFLNDPGQFSETIADIQKTDGIDWTSFSITADISEYEKAALPLHSVKKLADTLLAAMATVSITVLSLMQALFNRSRRQETGIQLSIGISKAEILLQRSLETAIIAAVAFLLGTCTAPAAWPLLQTGIFGAAAPAASNRLQTEALAATSAVMAVVGAFVLLLSIIFSNLWTMRLSPKKILSKLS